MLRRASILLLALTSLPAWTQQAPTASATAAKPADVVRLTKAVAESYYHPDDLGGMDCTVALDWAAFLSQLKVDTTADKAKAAVQQMQGMKLHSHAPRGKVPELKFDWNGVDFPGKDQMESGLTQTINGFYQFYWATFSMTSLTPEEITKVEPLADGGSNIHAGDSNSKIEIRVNPENVPTHYAFDVPAANGFFDVSYVASEEPKPGDMRRISEVKVTEHVGANTVNANVKLDYQKVDGYFIPDHVVFEIPGAYSMPLEFTSCTVSKIVPAAAE